MDDVKMQDVSQAEDMENEPIFSKEQQEILDLYDQVQKLELELALTQARVRLANESAGKARTGKSDDEDPQAIDAARDQLLEAMALYNLRNTVVNSVLTANPILKGIHASTYASPIEQDLPPWVEARDATAQDVAHAAAARRRLLDELTQVESQTLRATRRNRELAAEVLRLAAEADQGRRGALAEDPAAKNQIDKLESRLAASRQKWRVMKGTASGIVAGSGVDWVNDEELRDVVLDPE